MLRWIQGSVGLVLVLALPAAAAASATDLSPAPNTISPSSFVASAKVDGPATLTITPEGASQPVFSAPLKVEGVKVDDLASGPYVATWRTGETATYSSFVVRGATPPVAGGAPTTTGATVAQAPPGDLYLEGTGLVLATRFHNFVWSGPNGEDPHGWLTLNGYYTLHATVTCVALAPDSAVLGYRIDTGDYAGRGFLTWAEGPGPMGAGGYVHYAGILPAPPTTCPAPGAPPPPGFQNGGTGPVQEGAVGRRAEGVNRSPTAIVDLFPRLDGSAPSGPFTAYAGLDGQADGIELTLYPDGGSEPATRLALHADPGDLQWRGDLTDLPDGPYVAAWALDRGNGDAETVLSSFVHGGTAAGSAIAPPQGASVACAKLARARRACSLRLPISGLDRAWVSVTRERRTVVSHAVGFAGGTARLPGVSRLRAGAYGLTVGAKRGGHVYARLGLMLR
jgi:hypothetical protein